MSYKNRRNSLSDSDSDYCLSDSNSKSFTKKQKTDIINDIYHLPVSNKEYPDLYKNIKNQLIDKHVSIDNILSMDNILDQERIKLIEKYSLMNNSKEDLNTFIKLRDELLDMINYYNNSDMIEREKNIKKKKLLDNIIINNSELENKILNMFSDTNGKEKLYIQGLIYQKYKKLNNMSPIDSEYYKLKEWLDTATKIPFNNNHNNINNKNLGSILNNIKKGLDKELFGMETVKEEILMAINQRFVNPNNTDTCIALVGPPGIGKTKIITVLANILNYPWEHISMGGANDSSFLTGHSYTYEGAKSGKILDSLIKMQCNNGILFFDEIDKIADTANGKEVSNQLLHITDFTQNDHFCDKYLPEIPINLSKIWFIFSLNSINDIDPILRNRLNFIHVDGYTINEKITICKDYLLSRAFDKYKLNKNKYIFNDQIIRKIIIHSVNIELYNNNKQNQISLDNYRSGVRELKRSIDHLFNRLSLLENLSDNKLMKSLSFYSDKLNISEELIDKLLS